MADRARPTAKALLAAVLVFMAIVSLWIPLAFDRIAARWFSLPNILFFWWVPAVTALVAFAAWRSIESGREALPFLATIALFLLGYLGLLISNFPYIVPPSLMIWQAAAAPATHVFMLMGTLVSCRSSSATRFSSIGFSAESYARAKDIIETRAVISALVTKVRTPPSVTRAKPKY